MTSKITFKVGKENLSGMFFESESSISRANILFLHGAGKAKKDKVFHLAQALLENQISSFAFDFSGHGESSGYLQESSLQKRVQEAQGALEQFTTDKLTICAFSMGGHIALELLRVVPIQNLILFCPAIYTPEAFNLPFDERFSNVIRKPESWKNAEVIKSLQNFTGKILIMIGEKDEVIPKGVIELINSNAMSAVRKEIFIIPNVGHQILSAADKDRNLMNAIIKKVIQFSSAGE